MCCSMSNSGKSERLDQRCRDACREIGATQVLLMPRGERAQKLSRNALCIYDYVSPGRLAQMYVLNESQCSLWCSIGG